MAEELIPLNITIADRNYRIKVLPKDEEAVRKTLKVINDKILEFRGNFAGKDMQDYISMVLIWYATQPQAAKTEFRQEELSEILDRLEKHIEKFD